MKLALLLLTIPIAVSAECDDPALSVDFPFESKVARDNFAKCVSVDGLTDARLRRIERVCYAADSVQPGCQPGSTDCQNGDTYFKGVRMLAIGVDEEVSPKSVKGVLQANQKDGCDKFHLAYFSGGVERRRAAYQFRYNIKKRFCDNLLGTHDLCEGSVTGSYVVSLSDRLDLSSVPHLGEPSGRCLGVIPLNLTEDIVSSLISSTLGAGPLPIAKINLGVGIAALSGPALKGPESVNWPSLELTNMDYETDFEKGGFEELNGRHVIAYSEHGYLEGFKRDTYLRERKREINFLRRLSKSEPDTIIVTKGDNLSRIAERTYGDPRLFLVVDHINALKGRTIRIGEVLKIPQPHDICQLFQTNAHTVRRDESIWQKVKQGDIPSSIPDGSVYSGDADLIFPFEVLSDSPSNPTPTRP